MSNKACADLYTNIIEDVILESRQDFENAGIDEQTLQDLREIWRQRILASKVASFSWATPEEENGSEENEVADFQNKVDPAADNALLDSIVGNLKTEEDSDGDADPDADDELFGKEELTADVKEETPDVNKDKGPSLNFNIRNNQITGSIGYNESKSTSKSASKGNRPASSSRNDDDDDDDDDLGSDLGSDLGADSDAINSDLDDSDEDDDDDDSDADNDGDGDGSGNDIEHNIMLCLYDRVQRVRNRWKCSLKDGLMNIDGKDYVFQKATGDSEW